MKKVELEQNTKEWHEYRKIRIGASDAGCIMGLNPWKTSYQLWKEKMGTFCPLPLNEAMKRGLELEPFAREKVSKELGIELRPAVLQNDIEWCFASYDAISEDGKVSVEIKCPMRGLFHEIPKYYIPQLEHQMFVAGLEKCFFYSFDGNQGNLIEYKKNDFLCEEMIRKETYFYKRMIDFEPPELVEKDYVDMEWNEEWMKCAETMKKRK